MRVQGAPEVPPAVPDPVLLLAELFRGWGDFLYQRAFRATQGHDIAEDLVQETFFRVLRRIRGTPRWRPTPAYLIRALDNAVRDQWRSITAQWAALRAHASEQHSRPRPDDPASTWRRRRAKELLHEAVTALPGRRRQAFTLARVEGLSLHETAARMGISVKTVKEQLRVAACQIRESLRRRGIEALHDL